MNIVYARFNDSRKREYRLTTSIVDEIGERFALKQAAGSAGTVFLDSLFDKYERLSGSGLGIEPLAPVRQAGGIRFQYIPADSLDALVEAAVRGRDSDGVRAVFRTYRELIDAIPVAAADEADAFAAFFGDADAAESMQHLSVGCLDLILENIFVDDGGYRLIDYEWTFPFPLPKSLVLARTVMNTYFKYHAGGINQLVPAGELFGELGVDSADLPALLRMEWSFQEAVNERVQPYADFEALYHRVLYKPYGPGATLGTMREKYDEQAERLAAAEEELGHARRMLSDRDAEIASMKASKFWKLRELYARGRRLPGRLKR